MPPKKELHYFDRSNKYSSNSDLNASSLKKRIFSLRWYKIFRRDILKSLNERNYKDTVFYLKWHLSNYNDRWYLNLFKENYVSGEITPSYSLIEEDELLSIKNIAPDVKIIFILRNPINRAWSQFKYDQKFHKHLKKYTESEIIQYLKQKKVKSPHILVKHLKRKMKEKKKGGFFLTQTEDEGEKEDEQLLDTSDLHMASKIVGPKKKNNTDINVK